MPAEPFHRLFFAVRPPGGVIPEIAALRDAVGPTTGAVADARLHLTTWLFADSPDFPADAAARAQAAVAPLPLAPFRIALDRVVGGKGHVVLIPSEPPAGFVGFQARLDRALRAKGLVPRPNWRFSPHVTLLYGRHDLDRWIDTISWTAKELFLIDSVVGERRHDVVARWPLG